MSVNCELGQYGVVGLGQTGENILHLKGAAILECRPGLSNLPKCLPNVVSSVTLVNSNLKNCVCQMTHLRAQFGPWVVSVILALRATSGAATPNPVLCLYLAICGVWGGVGSFAQGVQEHSGVCSACFPRSVWSSDKAKALSGQRSNKEQDDI